MNEQESLEEQGIEPICPLCKSYMIPARIRTMSRNIVNIGRILLIPCIMGLASSICVFIHALVSLFTMEWSVAPLQVMGGAMLCVLLSLVTGVFGFFLTMKRGVLKCSSCGFIADRA